MKEHDISKLWMLLDIVHKASSAGPTYGWIVTMANDEINTYKPPPPLVGPAPAPADAATPANDFQAFNKTRLSANASGQDTDNE